MKPALEHWKGEFVIGCVLLATAGWFGALALDMSVGDFAMPGPGLFPFMLAALLALVAVALLVRARHARSTEAERVSLLPPNVLVAVGSLLIATALFENCGFLIAAMALLSFLFRALGGLTWPRAVLAGAVAAGIAWMLFVQLLGVQLPHGFLNPV